jgi:hypothetical protein
MSCPLLSTRLAIGIIPQPGSPGRAARPKAPSPATRWLVLHINREALHHGAEIALLRDLYANR